jgi:hypothetical protein
MPVSPSFDGQDASTTRGVTAGSDRLRWIFSILLLFVVCAICARGGLYKLFSTFVDYDDEGYLLISMKYFLEGFSLYDQVLTQYGPMFYSYGWLVHGVFGVGLTNDAVRFLTLFHWIGISGLYGWFVHRAGGSTLLTSAAFVLAFMHLGPIVNEPGHPQGLCGLLVATALVLCSFVGRHNILRAMALAGLVIGLLGMIKINLGVYLFLAVSMALLTSAEASRVTGVLRPLHIGLGLAVTPVVMYRWLTDEWTFLFWIVWTLTVISVLLVGRPAAADRIPGDGAYLRLALVASATMLAVALVQLIQGVSIATLAEGLIGQHVKFANAFYLFVEVPKRAGAAAVAAAALAIVYWRRASIPPAARPRVELGFAGMKLLYGLTVIGATSAAFASEAIGGSVDKHSPSGPAVALMIYGLPFSWLLLARTEGLAPPQRVARLAVCLMASFQTLQAFPIAGTQVSQGTVLLLLIGLLCVHDVLTQTEAGRPMRIRVRRLGYGFMVLALLTIVLLRGEISRREYRSSVPLGLPGAARIRLPQETSEAYLRLVRNLRAHCDTFVSFPGMNSLYLWAQKEPPTLFNATFWPNMLSDRQQFAVARTIAGDPRACFVLNLRKQEVFHGLGYSLLANFLYQNFRSTGVIGPYDLLIRNDRRGEELLP